VQGNKGLVRPRDRGADPRGGPHEVASWPPEYLADRPGGTTPHAAMALPIEVGGNIAAVLFITRIGAERSYSELECGIADLLTAQIAIALQNADLHARVAESALRDPLTGLLNRRFFDEAVETCVRQRPSSRHGTEPDRSRPGSFLCGQQRVRTCRRRRSPAAGGQGDPWRNSRG